MQMADGVSDSRSHHRFLTSASNIPLDVVVRFSKFDNETLPEKLSLDSGYSSRERIHDSDFPKKLCPSPPSPLSLPVRFFLLRIHDSSSICNTRQTNEKISSGRREMAKLLGMICGKYSWKRRVSTSLGGSSSVSGDVFPRTVPAKLRISETSFRLPRKCWGDS